jgi:ribosomal-protein-alanine N-acetyltransferase
LSVDDDPDVRQPRLVEQSVEGLAVVVLLLPQSGELCARHGPHPARRVRPALRNIPHVDELMPGYLVRSLTDADAPGLADAAGRNREHLAPWEPWRGEDYYTVSGQQRDLVVALEAIEAGRLATYVVTARDQIVGKFNLNNIVRGAFQSADIGYWVDHQHLNRGLATAAVRYVCDQALRMGLHRVGAGTLLHNDASQTVLRRCGFTRYGTAERYVFIAGRWQDHALFHRILHDQESLQPS